MHFFFLKESEKILYSRDKQFKIMVHISIKYNGEIVLFIQLMI